jgi:hypothetical protein
VQCSSNNRIFVINSFKMPNFTNDLTDTVLGYGAAGSNAVLVTEQLFYLLLVILETHLAESFKR